MYRSIFTYYPPPHNFARHFITDHLSPNAKCPGYRFRHIRGNKPEEIITSIFTYVPPPPRQLDPTIPVHLDQACMRLLEKMPENRFQTAQEFIAALAGTTPIVGASRFCTGCGTPTQTGARYCHNCGTALATVQNQPARCLACGRPTGPETLCTVCGRPFGNSGHHLCFTTGSLAGMTFRVPEGIFSVGRNELSPTGVTATLTQGGGVTWQPSPASGGNDCAVGTDAYNTFSGIADMTGVIYYGSAGWWIDLVFTGLDPATEYTFATSSARCAYTNRLTTYTLGGADTYYNASTLGVDVLAENRIRFNTGDNYSEGYVARWTGITAADGSFTVRAEADPGGEDGRRAYSFDVFMLEGGFKGSDLQGKMQGVNASLWSRIDFDVEDPSVFNKLTLRMKYEDGFVAYLNGVEVVRDNLSGTPMWNSQADGNRQDELALQFIDFDISSHISYLRQGHNVLAIHGLNNNVDDPNFLILPELVAVSDSGLSIYERALILLDGLRITEIMYHSPSGSNFDYIELQNISDKTLKLDGVQFLEGVEFVFPNMELEAGEYVVVVSNLAAFRSMYGMGPSVAGVYSGGLSGGGEDIVLTIAWPLDAAIMRFGYSDKWYPATDGGGQSLHIIDATAHPATWDDAKSWRAAAPSPGEP